MGHYSANRASDPLRLCLFGASPDTANLGVSALFLSVLNSVATRYPDAKVTVFDYGRGVRKDRINLDGKWFDFTRCGANLSRRFYRRDSLLNMRVSAALGGLGNPGVKAIAEADAVLDISGGDSFADLYGDKRFKGITQPKRLSIDLGTPLVLLPQTYGPYAQPKNLETARRIVRDSHMAWARDARSFETLSELAGDMFSPDRHCAGVDVAFALPKVHPDNLPERLQASIGDNRSRPLIGFNVSGLIYTQGAEGSRQFGFKDDYRDIVHNALRRLLDESDADILLIPHVLARLGHYESDPQANLDVMAKFDGEDRIFALQERYNAMEMKWVISHLDFFCGTRMHSTIAGLSSGVPTAAIAYSKKTLGVFETCGQGECVTDPRFAGADECAEDILRIWQNRDAVASSLREKRPVVLRQAEMQSEKIFDSIDRLRGIGGSERPGREASA